MIDFYWKVPEKRKLGMGMGLYGPFATATDYSAFTGLLYLCIFFRISIFQKSFCPKFLYQI